MGPKKRAVARFRLSAYSYRVWITLIKLLYAPLLYHLAARIFTYLSKFADGCYKRYCGFPRRTLLVKK